MTILREKKNFDIQSYGVKFSYFSFRGFNKGFIYLKEKEIPSAEIQKLSLLFLIFEKVKKRKLNKIGYR